MVRRERAVSVERGEAEASSSEQVNPVRRAYVAGSGAKDADAFQTVLRLRVLLWSTLGAFLGFLMGVWTVAMQGTGYWVVPVTTVMGWAISYFGPLFVAHVAGSLASTVHAPSGASTPRRKEYSLAESLVVRGLYDEATAAYRQAIEDDPADWQPYVRIARMRRDRASDPEGAAVWFKRALTDVTMPSGPRLLALKEYVELCHVRLKEPGKAAPALARIAELEADTAEGEWAAEALGQIKEAMSQRDVSG